MQLSIEVASAVEQTPRVLQMASMFDIAVQAKTSRRWEHDLPLEERRWQVGLVVGPSGAGKSTLARRAWPDALVSGFDWPRDQAVIDAFPDGMPIRDVIGHLTAVGLSSPPAWMRPHATLSNGEQFRATIARALAENTGLVAVDEFTSVVDRQVAAVVSHTVAKTVRRDPGRQFVAVTCHYDVVAWLQPDWVYDVAAGSFAWRSVQPRPRVSIDIGRVDRSLWRVFSHHHYLSADLAKSAQCFGAFIDGQPVGFMAYIHFPHAEIRNLKMTHRLVVLPDYQGLGLGRVLLEWLGQHLYGLGYRYRVVAAHPAVMRALATSARWRDVTQRRRHLTSGPNAVGNLTKHSLNVRRFFTRSFEYCPPAAAPAAG